MYEDDMYRQTPYRNPMATAAMILGIVSLVFFSIFYIALPCGSLAVICSILSRGESRMTGKSKAGIVCGICGIAATIVISVTAVYTVLNDSQMRSYMEQLIQLYTGDDDFDLDQDWYSDPSKNNQQEEIIPFENGDEGVFL
ncbi:MAG: DUF4190 domain-containing protein [Candidatus Choladocola sp.]|nr:DUF4190 domain-containing protein [Candidatus Choladocola sp.]